MKPQLKTKISKETLLSVQARPSKSAEEGGVSLSFQDELAATIHGAFEVAVEIAVLEVTKLVGQALGDVRDQMHETLRENKSLKQRLETTEQELNVARERVTAKDASELGQLSTSPHKNNSPTNASNAQKQSKDMKSTRTVGSVPKTYIQLQAESLIPPRTTTHSKTPSKRLLNPEIDYVRVKEEQGILDSGSRSGSGCSFDSLVEEDLGPDSLSFVQSKMLEEWKPDPLHVQISDSPVPGTSHTLSHNPMGHSEAPQLTSTKASALPAFSSQFPNSLFRHGEAAASIAPSAPLQIYGVQVGTQRAPDPASSLPVHVCKLCGQAFHQPSELRRHHSRVHPKRQMFPPGQSPYHCSECSRDFNRLENLKTHLRIHTGERPYTCSVCAMRFRHSGALTRHFRIHTGEKPYVCGQCGKTFRNCGGLRFHQRSHGRQGQS
ncbi:hypothetical protein DPEC_G00100350 [Dallia pectoralis]|uniref:Uncharacterized protein n=1 Tax=Dallia pectoralis TaxID=75939 RepID=A0ACC2GX10_DALPE|nr:hypothetical protein DPEC_G00100350 [Dallia pectoralis]